MSAFLTPWFQTVEVICAGITISLPVVGRWKSDYFSTTQSPIDVDVCAEKLSLLSWRSENRFFEMPDVIVSPAEAGRLSLS
jgi:hypothetical protein